MKIKNVFIPSMGLPNILDIDGEVVDVGTLTEYEAIEAWNNMQVGFVKHVKWRQGVIATNKRNAELLKQGYNYVKCNY